MLQCDTNRFEEIVRDVPGGKMMVSRNDAAHLKTLWNVRIILLRIVALFLASTSFNTLAAEEPVVESARYLGIQFRDNNVDISGQDAATSIVLPGGNESFWIFGDTVEGPFPESLHDFDLTDVLSNTASIIPFQDAADGLQRFEYIKTADGKRARQLIKHHDDENPTIHRLWGIHGICVEDQIYLFYHKITMLPETSVFDDFKLNGMGIAKAKIGTYDFKRLKAPDGSREFWKGDQPGYGVFVEQLDDGYVYLWGSYWTGMFLARTRPESIEDLASYEYLVEAPTAADPDVVPKWSKQYAPTAVLFDSVPNEMSAAYNPYLKQHIAIHTFLRENKIVLRTAPNIWGPWSEPEIIYEPEPTVPPCAFFAGKEHPELAKEGGRVIYVTYVDSKTYMPHLLEVKLARKQP